MMTAPSYLQAGKEGRLGDLARANIATCGYCSGVGKTTAALRAANPSDEDLKALDARIKKGQPQICRALACFRVTVHLVHFMKKGTSYKTSDAEFARYAPLPHVPRQTCAKMAVPACTEVTLCSARDPPVSCSTC